MKVFNVIRYVSAIALPIILLFNVGGLWFLVSVILCLYLNNVIDDIVFYYGSKYVDTSESYIGVPSPVEGVVTLVERDVPLFNHLFKNDILTKEQLVEKGISITDGEYKHVAIFLNKLNKHLVASIGNLKSINEYSFQNGNVEMVSDGELISNNKGEYLKNTFVDLEYDNGVHVVVTMDKYISKAIRPSKTELVEMLICRGSQCDIYAPAHMGILVECFNAINILQPLFLDYGKKNFDTFEIKEAVDECIMKSGFNIKKAFLGNLRKTFSTVNYNYLWLAISLISALFSPLTLSLGLYLYLFLFDRSLKNYFYATMNNIGYKSWMTIIYNSLHKIVIYGKQRA